MFRPPKNEEATACDRGLSYQSDPTANQATDSIAHTGDSWAYEKLVQTLQAKFALVGAQLIPGAHGFTVACGGFTRHLTDLREVAALLKPKGGSK